MATGGFSCLWRWWWRWWWTSAEAQWTWRWNKRQTSWRWCPEHAQTGTGHNITQNTTSNDGILTQIPALYTPAAVPLSSMSISHCHLPHVQVASIAVQWRWWSILVVVVVVVIAVMLRQLMEKSILEREEFDRVCQHIPIPVTTASPQCPFPFPASP